MKKPKKGEYAPFHETYIKALPKRGSAKSLLKSSMRELQAMLSKLSEEQGDYTYAQGKWTIKQVLIHLIDAERVFAFRTLWFMRGDRAPLPGFNQDFWMEHADVRQRSVADLLKEFKTVRESTLMLLAQCSEEQSAMTGVASTFKVSVRANFYIIIGHHLHHMQVLKERYGL